MDDDRNEDPRPDTCWAQVGEDFCPNDAEEGSDYCEEHEYLND